MDNFAAAFAAHPSLFLSIPLVAAALGWATNALALRMLCHPLEFIGQPPRLGWQGVLPRHAPELAAGMAREISRDLLTPAELYEAVDPDLLVHVLEKPLRKELADILDHVMQVQQPALWTVLPVAVKKRTLRRLTREVPGEIRTLLDRLREELDTLVDPGTLIAARVQPDRRLVVEPFLQTTRRERRFLRMTGLVLGFAAGLLELVCLLNLPPAVGLAGMGLLVGAGTNWVALQLLFRPGTARQIGPLHIQGLLYRRHREIARAYAKAAAGGLLKPGPLLQELLCGPAGDRLAGWVNASVKDAFRRNARMLGTYISLREGNDALEAISETVSSELWQRLPLLVRHLDPTLASAFRFETLLPERAAALPAERFASCWAPVLQPYFPLLIGIGAAIGFAVGCFQRGYTFSGIL